MENKITQLRKGILELAILGCLHSARHYGYSLVKSIAGEGDVDLTEGTIYPILSRLAKEDLVQSEWVESPQGPPRKYYFLTAKGEEAYKVLHAEFEKLASVVSGAGRKREKKAPTKKTAVITMKKEASRG